MAYLFNELKEAPAVCKVPPRTLPLKFCYLAQTYYEFLTTHGLKDFAKVTAISCTKNPLAKGVDDYFITSVTHTDTADGKPTTIAFYEVKPNWLNPSVQWQQLHSNFGICYASLRDLAERHGLPIAFYFEAPDNREKGELDEMSEAGIDWKP